MSAEEKLATQIGRWNRRYLPDLGISLERRPSQQELAHAIARGQRRIDALEAYLKAHDDVVACGIVDDFHWWPQRCEAKDALEALRALVVNLQRERLVIDNPTPTHEVGVDLFSTAPPPVEPLPRSAP